MMGLLRRRERPPADVVALLDRDERIVSWADVDDGTAVVATSAGLWWPNTAGSRRISWHLIDKAVWRDGQLTVIEAEVADEVLLVEKRPVSVPICVARDLPPTVRKRIESTVVRSQVLPVDGGSARFVARRMPGMDGVNWFARLEDGTPDTPLVREQIRARIAQFRAAWNAAL